jgi:hypothetical protein
MRILIWIRLKLVQRKFGGLIPKLKSQVRPQILFYFSKFNSSKEKYVVICAISSALKLRMYRHVYLKKFEVKIHLCAVKVAF